MLDTPMYPPYLAGRLTGLSAGRVSRWLRGYHYSYEYGGNVYRGQKDGLIEREGAEDSSYASFLDLMDLIFIKKFLAHGFSLQKMRKALEEVKSIFSGHHFAQRMFWTDGSKIYVEIERSKSTEESALLELLSGGQWVISNVITDYSHRIDFNKVSGFAERWFPNGRSGHIVVDPEVNFGAPSILGRGVETANIYDSFEAEGRDASKVANWMNLPEVEVIDAVEFEKCLRIPS